MYSMPVGHTIINDNSSFGCHSAADSSKLMISQRTVFYSLTHYPSKHCVCKMTFSWDTSWVSGVGPSTDTIADLRGQWSRVVAMATLSSLVSPRVLAQATKWWSGFHPVELFVSLCNVISKRGRLYFRLNLRSKFISKFRGLCIKLCSIMHCTRNHYSKWHENPQIYWVAAFHITGKSTGERRILLTQVE